MSSDEERSRDGIMTVFRPTAEEVEAEEQARAAGGGRGVMLGKHGSMYRDYLKENRPVHFAYLALEAALHDVCLEVGKEAREMFSTIERQLRAKLPHPDASLGYMATVQYETMIRDQAEEIVLAEVVYRDR